MKTLDLLFIDIPPITILIFINIINVIFIEKRVMLIEKLVLISFAFF